jgi:hypothetical protein
MPMDQGNGAMDGRDAGVRRLSVRVLEIQHCLSATKLSESCVTILPRADRALVAIEQLPKRASRRNSAPSAKD